MTFGLSTPLKVSFVREDWKSTIQLSLQEAGLQCVTGVLEMMS